MSKNTRKIKRLTYTNVGGCGGPVWVSQKRAGVELQVRYVITPTWRYDASTGSSVSTGALLRVNRLKKGTTGVWIPVFGIDTPSLDYAKLLAQAFDDVVQNPYYTPEQQRVIEEAEAIRLREANACFKKTSENLMIVEDEIQKGTPPPEDILSTILKTAHTVTPMTE